MMRTTTILILLSLGAAGTAMADFNPGQITKSVGSVAGNADCAKARAELATARQDDARATSDIQAGENAKAAATADIQKAEADLNSGKSGAQAEIDTAEKEVAKARDDLHAAHQRKAQALHDEKAAGALIAQANAAGTNCVAPGN